MSVELISVLVAVLAIGASLAGLILTSNRGLRQDIRQDMARLESRVDDADQPREYTTPFFRKPRVGNWNRSRDGLGE